MKKNIQDKLATIQALLKQKEAIDKRLETLLDSSSSVAFPDGIGINDEILEILKASPEGVPANVILKTLQNNHPELTIRRKRVAGALSYLKNRKNLIISTERGSYMLNPSPTPNNPNQMETASGK